MGNLDQLLEALARQLPSSADGASIVAALREAGKALPENQAKTRKRLARTEEACVEKLQALLKQAPAEVHEDVAAEAGVDVEDDAAAAAYNGVSEDDPAACVARFAELVQAALASLRPTLRAEDSLEGFLAVLPAGKISFTLNAFQECMQLLPKAAAALAGSEPPAWRRYLGFLLTALSQLKGSDAVSQKDAQDVAVRLGGLIALSSSRACARASLRHGLSAIGDKLSASALTRLSSAVLPIMSVAFGGPNTWEDRAVVRSDLVVLLHAFRFVGLCRKNATGEMQTVNEASDLLRLALEKHFDVVALSAKLQSMGLHSSKRRKLAKAEAHASSRAACATLVSDTILRAAPTLSAATIAQLANSAGLPAGEEEEANDRRAAAARAKGELFFEDVGGDDLAETTSQIAGNVFATLGGVDNLKTPKKKRKTQKSSANGEAAE